MLCTLWYLKDWPQEKWVLKKLWTELSVKSISCKFMYVAYAGASVWELWQLYQKETPAQMFSCELWEIFKKTYLEEHLCWLSDLWSVKPFPKYFSRETVDQYLYVIVSKSRTVSIGNAANFQTFSWIECQFSEFRLAFGSVDLNAIYEEV